MDRFNSQEDVKWDPAAELKGMKARLDGFDMTLKNPYIIGTWAWKSFNAGWADADMDPDNSITKKENS